MASKIGSSENKVKRKTVRTTIELRKELISKNEAGSRVSDLAREYGIPKSTISTILKNKEAIKRVDVAKGVTSLTAQRTHTIETMEKLLLVWIKEKQMAGDSITEKIICEKAKQLHSDLKKDNPGISTRSEEFKASKGWFDRFKRRSGINSDNEMAKKFVEEFKDFIDSEGYVPQQVFNCDKTVLFWKKMPKMTYITQEEAALPEDKPTKDRLTILLCGNVAGDFKLKPLLVYLADNPRAFLKHNVQKSKLGVMWRANSRAWVTRKFFTEWVNEVFAPCVRRYLDRNDLPLKALLLMDRAPAHPPSLGGDLVGNHSFITVKFIPPSIAPFIQPMNQQVIPNFKQLYTKALFQRCFEVTSDTDITFQEFWKSHFNILQCVRLIVKAWGDVSLRTMNSAWKKLWPDSVARRDFKAESESVVQEIINLSASMGLKADHEDVEKLWSDYVASREFEAESESLVQEIISLGESMGLEVDQEDVREFTGHHWREHTTEELQDLHNEQAEEQAEDFTLVKNEDGVQEAKISNADLNELLFYWSKTKSIVEKWHPDSALVNQNINSFNENVVEHFRKIKRDRLTQTLDKFISKQKTLSAHTSSESPESSGSECQESSEPSAKTQNRDNITPELPDVFMEDDSLLNSSLPYLQFQLCQSSEVNKDCGIEDRADRRHLYNMVAPQQRSDMKRCREAKRAKRARLNLEAKKAQHAVVSNHKLLSEPESKEVMEDAEMGEDMVSTLNDKPHSLDCAMAAEIKQEYDGDLLELKEEKIDIKTEPVDDAHLDKKLPAEAPEDPEAKKSNINFEEVWIKAEDDVNENTCP